MDGYHERESKVGKILLQPQVLSDGLQRESKT
jgi:hypothetical protein